jgi:hypothetical protein
MEKILVEVFLPAANKSFDVYIPLKLRFYEVTFMIAKAVSELSNGFFNAQEVSLFCEKSTGKLLNVNRSSEELGLKNGSKLMLL